MVSSTLGKVDVCNSCAMKTDSKGMTVGGYLERGNNEYNRSKHDEARRSYKVALYILENKPKQGCSGCIKAAQFAVDQL